MPWWPSAMKCTRISSRWIYSWRYSFSCRPYPASYIFGRSCQAMFLPLILSIHGSLPIDRHCWICECIDDIIKLNSLYFIPFFTQSNKHTYLFEYNANKKILSLPQPTLDSKVYTRKHHSTHESDLLCKKEKLILLTETEKDRNRSLYTKTSWKTPGGIRHWPSFRPHW